jgi:hypothetical protein
MVSSKTPTGISSKIHFSSWVPLDAQEAFNIFYPIVASEARDMLRRLAEWPTMKDAWAELPHFQKVTPSDLVTSTLMAWLSALRIERRRRRYAPRLLRTDQAADSDVLAPNAWAIANYVRSVNPIIRARKGITETTLEELDRVAAFIEREAEDTEMWVKIARPPRKAGARNAHHVAFVNCMCDMFLQPKGRRPYSLVAILVNVAFSMESWDDDRVKHCYRSRSSNKGRGNIRRLSEQ